MFLYSARVLFLCTMLLGAVVFAANAPSKSGLSASDEKFVKEAAQGGMMEVALGQIAVEKATHDQVKQFGQRMVDDHGKANQELMALAKNKNVALAGDLGGRPKKTVDRLSQSKQFDRDYMNAMVDDHKEDIKAFERAADKAQDGEVKNFAAKTLSTLKTHLQLARETQKALKSVE